MFNKNNKNPQIGQTKRTTDELINDAIARQNSWMDRRRAFARRFLKAFGLHARPDTKPTASSKKAIPLAAKPESADYAETPAGIASYWFPLLCLIVVVFIIIWALFLRAPNTQKIIVVPTVPEPVVQTVAENTIPSFDIVRIERDGNIVVAGRGAPNANISILINGKLVATQRTSSRGEFVYSPTKPFEAGNYTFALIDADTETESADRVFVYVSPRGYKNSVSLLMTREGSTLLQSPTLVDGDLSVSKIDYLDTGRIVVTGDALPRLRVSLTLNDKYLGFARVSDYKHFGLGADVGELKPGNEYNLSVRLHDGDGRTVAIVSHKFTMPEMTGDDDTFYTVRRGDCLWIIARNFLRRGVLFSMIAERNNIENPDLIFPKQILQIPTK
jgi:nucleoid-associated protein YgaU